jgi:hypothetical protein
MPGALNLSSLVINRLQTQWPVFNSIQGRWNDFFSMTTSSMILEPTQAHWTSFSQFNLATELFRTPNMEPLIKYLYMELKTRPQISKDDNNK